MNWEKLVYNTPAVTKEELPINYFDEKQPDADPAEMPSTELSELDEADTKPRKATPAKSRMVVLTYPYQPSSEITAYHQEHSQRHPWRLALVVALVLLYIAHRQSQPPERPTESRRLTLVAYADCSLAFYQGLTDQHPGIWPATSENSTLVNLDFNVGVSADLRIGMLCPGQEAAAAQAIPVGELADGAVADLTLLQESRAGG